MKYLSVTIICYLHSFLVTIPSIAFSKETLPMPELNLGISWSETRAIDVNRKKKVLPLLPAGRDGKKFGHKEGFF